MPTVFSENLTFSNVGITAALVIVAFFVGLGLFLLIIAFLPDSTTGEGKQRLKRFFKRDPEELSIVTENFYRFQLPNLQLGIDSFLKQPDIWSEVLGSSVESFRQIVDSTSKFTNIRYRELDIDGEEKIQCAENGLYLVSRDDEKVAILISFMYWQEQLTLEVMSESLEMSSQYLDILRGSIAANDVYRGKVITLESAEPVADERGWAGFQMQSLRSIERDDIILPDATMDLVERNSIRFFQHAESLRQAGQDVKRGLLFHGAPGTGKTLVAQWIAQCLENTTVVIVSGEQLWKLKESCRVARMLAPSLIILEDVDLIATARDESMNTTALHQLLNEMDGTTPQSDVLYLLTTNVPEAIEPALANRPGRVDQAIEFPLPDVECRRKLLNLYGRGVGLDVSTMSSILNKTESATPAFLKELVRKAVLIASENLSAGNGCALSVSESDLDEALREMTLENTGITKRIFGFTSENL